ncbi:phage tail tape measure protein [Cryobacterium sp. Y57]|uniref:phage tail tape measure protein n=1 Tax=Cryobacterium sp. Y57 TaxID=2048287 RepID=UPI001E3AB3D8|nr:phage tail tape measure protein [Cryobacterium sp. Y57]
MATLRAAQLEVLFTADTSQVQKADKDVKSIGERIEKKPIKQKLTADASEVLSSADRIEAAYKVAFANTTEASARQKRALVSNYLESDRAAGKSAAQIQSVLTRSYGIAESAARELAKVASGEIRIKVDVAPALESMDRVEAAARKLVSQDTSLKLDADVTRAEKGLARAQQRLADLEVRALGGLDVTADVRRAEAALSKIERNLAGLQSARTMIAVDADPTPAESRLSRFFSRFRSEADAAGQEGGKSFSKGLDSATRGAGQKVGEAVGGDIEGTLIAALAAIPIAGGIVLAGVAIGKAISGAIQDGLQVEVGNDRLQALTGISEADALRLGRAAGEAYTKNFGDSVEANMDTTRLALQFDLIDEDASTKSAQKVVEGLSGIADVLGEDVRPIAAAVTTLLSSGVAKSAENAFDLLATGAREGVNRSEDLIDTFTEYPAVFARLGLSGEEALGLMNQGLDAGARNSDIAADALKEFQIRATDASKASTVAFESLGFNAEEMTAKISRGGADARDGLDEVLKKLRETEDPVLRNAAAVGLFGTKAEDMGAALFAMDLSTAVTQLNGVQGAAQKMFDTLTDNDATKMEQAKRNIEVATDGMKGALAAAFSDPLGEAADWISQNRGPMLQFFQDLANGALDFGHTLIDAAADGAEAFGEFVSGPLADMVEGIAGAIDVMNGWEGRPKELDALADSMRGFDSTTEDAADTIRGLHDDLDDTAGTFNGFMDGTTAMGYLNDASLRLIDTIGEVGVTAEGATYGLDGIDLANIRASDSGKLLEDQVRNSLAAMGEQTTAAATAGESQDELAARYRTSTDALVGQLTQMGLTEEQTRKLIDTVLQTPPSATTEFGSNAEAQQAKVQGLADRITTLPDGTVVIDANTATAEAKVNRWIEGVNGRRVRATVDSVGGETYRIDGTNIRFSPNAQGSVTEFMAAGGVRGLTPMQPIAQVVPANTWRVVGDRGDVPESFIPIDGSARSMSILLETMRRMEVMPMAAGGITASTPSNTSRTAPGITNNFNGPIGANADDVIRKLRIGQHRAQMMSGIRGVGVI